MKIEYHNLYTHFILITQNRIPSIRGLIGRNHSFIKNNLASPGDNRARPGDNREKNSVSFFSHANLFIMILPGMETENENNLLAEFLSGRHYQQVSLRKLATGHLLIEACINDIPGAFILDSGAGATVVDERNIELFRLNASIDSVTGAGAGGTGLTVYISSDNSISISEFYISSFKVAAMDFEHVNVGLQQYGVNETIHGVIGGDLLEQANAIIDYPGKCLYLKMK